MQRIVEELENVEDEISNCVHEIEFISYIKTKQNKNDKIINYFGEIN